MKLFKKICLITFSTLALGLIVFYGIEEYRYSPERLDEAIQDKDFGRIHKIMANMAKDGKYNRHGFWGNQESKYELACRRVIPLEVNHLVKDGAIERVIELHAVYDNIDKEKFDEIVKEKAPTIMKNLQNYELNDLLLIVAYLPLNDIVNKAITINPNPQELVQFLRKLPFDAPSPVTGHIEDPEALNLDQYVNQKINAFNSACDIALEYALQHHDRDLCNEILSVYKDNVNITLIAGHTWTNDEYLVKMEPEQKNRARHRVIEAFGE